jgi:hypothetical protein
MYVYMYVCMYTCMHVCIHVCMYVCVYACMHACNEDGVNQRTWGLLLLLLSLASVLKIPDSNASRVHLFAFCLVL